MGTAYKTRQSSPVSEFVKPSSDSRNEFFAFPLQPVGHQPGRRVSRTWKRRASPAIGSLFGTTRANLLRGSTQVCRVSGCRKQNGIKMREKTQKKTTKSASPDPIRQPSTSKTPILRAAPSVPVATKAGKGPASASLKSPKPAAQKPSPTTPKQPPPQPSALSPAAVPAPRPRNLVNVPFILDSPNAVSVSVCGDFNDWTPGATPLKRQPGGPWRTALALAPGRYEYKFVVDEVWVSDPGARQSVQNEHGTQNSVIEVGG